MTTQLRPHQQRVVQEKQELDVKIKALSNFLEDDTKTSLVQEYERVLLVEQLISMMDYSNCLLNLIEFWSTGG